MSRPPGSPLRSHSPAFASASTAPNPHAELNELWKKALEAYQQKTGKELVVSEFAQKIIECETGEAVSELIDQRTAAFKEYRAYGGKTKEVLKRAVPILRKFSDAAADATSSVVPGSRFIVAGITTLLEGAAKVSELYDMIEDSLSEIGHALARFETYLESPNRITPRLSGIFVESLVIILSLLGTLTKYCDQTERQDFRRILEKMQKRSNTEKIKLRATDYFKGLLGEKEFQDEMKNLQRLSEDEAKQAVAEIHRGIGEGRFDVASVHADVLEIKKSQDYDNIKKWIGAPDVEDYHHEIHSRAKTSCEWILDGENFQQWMQTGNSVYSMIADAGSGKSTMCSLLIEALTLQFRTSDLPLVYFYFNSTSASTTLRSRRALMSSLVFQIASSSKSTWDYLQDQQKVGASLSHDRLSAMLCDLVGKVERPLFVFIDALDESSERIDMLDLLKDLCALKSDHLRLLVTTRPENNILASLTELPSTNRFELRLQNEHAHHDGIQKYVRDRLGRRQFRNWKTKTREAAAKALTDPEKSQGMFLWVSLQLEQLEMCPEAEVDHTLNQLPAGLDATYRQILSRFKPPPRLLSRVRAILGFIAVSERPLTTDEVAAAFTFNFAEGTAFSGLKPEQDAARRYLPSLIKIVDHSPNDWYHAPSTVHFIHFSVKEYLFSSSLCHDNDRSLARTYYLDHYFADISVATLLLAVFARSPALDALQSYAIGAWHLHVPPSFDDRLLDSFLDLPDPRGWQDATMLLNKCLANFLSPGSPSLETYLAMSHRAKLPQRRATLEISLLWAARLALRSRTKRLLLLDTSYVNRTGDFGWHSPMTPLTAAASRGTTAHFELINDLISYGADINLRPDGGESALEHALQNPEPAQVLEYLVSRDADVNTAAPDSGATVVHGAASRDLVAALETLIRLGADIEARDNEGQTALHCAARSKKPEGVRILLGSGAEPNSATIHGHTPLHFAAALGNVAAVQALLDHKADAQARTTSISPIISNPFDHRSSSIPSAPELRARAGFTALHAAVHSQSLFRHEGLAQGLQHPSFEDCYRRIVRESYTAIGELLLGIGNAQELVNISDSGGRTALHYSWDTDLLALLLKSGARPNAADSEGRTPLHAAVGAGLPDCVQALLAHGADPNVVDAAGRTSLHVVMDKVSHSGLAKAVEMLPLLNTLLAYGADPNIADVWGLTPLHAAIRNRSANIAKALLAHGADANIADSKGRTALHYEAMRGTEGSRVWNLLLKRGARLNVVDDSGATPGELAREAWGYE